MKNVQILDTVLYKILFTDFSIGDNSSQNLEVDAKNHSTSKTENLQNIISIPNISKKEVSQTKNSLGSKDQNEFNVQPKTETENNSKITEDSTKSQNNSSNENHHSTKVCDQKVIFVERGTHQVIKSPNYPKKSQNNLNCTWTLSTVRNDERVRLVFDSLDIGTNGDKLILYDGDSTETENLMTGPMDQVKFGQNRYIFDKNLRNCDFTKFFRIKASGTKRPYFSSGKFLTIQFLTNENSQSTGFHLSSTSARKGM